MHTFIFDLDGTLIDSFSQITEAANLTRKSKGFQPLDASRAHDLIGLPASRLFDDIAPSAIALEKLVSEFRAELLMKIEEENIVYKGAKEFVSECRNMGITIGVATSKPQLLAEKVIENSELDKLVDFVQGTDDFAPKPSPIVINKVMEALSSDKAIMFGDRPEDAQAAVAAGIMCVGITQSVFVDSDLIEAGARFTASSFEELLEFYPDPSKLLKLEN